jgi:probable rRNA maturation factor
VHAAGAEGFHDGQLSIAVVGRRAMSTLHERFMQQTGPTDVLSFDLGTDKRGGVLEGEVIVCADVARQRARTRGGTLRAAREELTLYVVHGVLHLAGYDDRRPRDFDRLHAREDALLRELGLGAVFEEGHPKSGIRGRR